MDILQKIVKYKRKEIQLKKDLFPVSVLEKSSLFKSKTFSLTKAILNTQKSGIIAEFKRKSPSKPNINLFADAKEITTGYVKAKVSGLSVLTDLHFFGGSLKDLTIARENNQCPILRKDFIIDTYQIIEAKSYGADAILLIAEILTKEQVIKLSKFAQSLDLEVLLEIHSNEQLVKLVASVNLLGVNNRNLKTFEVSINTSLQIATKINSDIVLVSESGITTIESIKALKKVGYKGFLIGEAFMKNQNPAAQCNLLSQQILAL